MKKTTVSLGESLILQGLLTPEQLKQVESEMQKSGESFQKVLRRFRFVHEKEWVSFLSSHFGIAQVEVTHQIVKPEMLKQIPEDLVRRFGVFPLMKVGKRLTVAMSDPFNLAVIDQLRLKTGYDIDLMLATESEIRSAIEQNYGLKSEMSDMVELMKGDPHVPLKRESAERERRELQVEETPVIKLVNLMLLQAFHEGASDIHVEPEKDKVLVRYRIDGILREIDQYPKSAHAGIVSRIKVMANLDIAENRIPQDGRTRFEFENQTVDLRVSLMPTVHGENIVLRLLNTQNANLPFEKLGMSNERMAIFKNLITKPYGIFLITGPTGSGKTTTLYAALHQINSPTRNIVTIEDPVEYQLPLIRQIPVNPKVNLTFATGLRSILRQDPDVIMVGEIRDKETAEIAIQAALTGHMVFSTLHTNNAASAVSRLLDMGIEPFLVSSTVVGIMAQRLIRTICKDCRESYPASDIELNFLKTGTQNERADSGIKLSRGKGCLTCKKTGYRGRNGLFEILVPNDDIRRLVMKRSSSEEIEKSAIQNGMLTLKQDGFDKIKSGITTLEEIFRVTQE